MEEKAAMQRGVGARQYLALRHEIFTPLLLKVGKASRGSTHHHRSGGVCHSRPGVPTSEVTSGQGFRPGTGGSAAEPEMSSLAQNRKKITKLNQRCKGQHAG